MKMKLLSTALLAIAWMSSASAVTLGVTGVTYEEEGVDGDELGNLALIDEFYNGGTDSQGNFGPDLGMQFGGTATALIHGPFTNEPSPDTVMFYAPSPHEAPGPGNSGFGLVNLAAGFDVGISFLFSQRQEEASTVQVFSGLNGTGTELASLSLFQNWQDGCAPAAPAVATLSGGGGGAGYCNWDVASLAFDGIAQSIILSGAAGRVLFDNLTLGSLEPVPLPAAAWLLGSGLLGFAAIRRRRQGQTAAAA